MKQLLDLFKENNGIVKLSQVTEKGITKPTFYEYIKNNNIQKVARGVYADENAWIDKAYILSIRCPGVILSHEEALYIHDLTDREPIKIAVTVKTGYNPSRLKEECKVYSVKKELHDVGKVYIKDSFGNSVPTYDIERTICDIVRSRNSLDTYEVNEAIKRYVNRNDKNINRLMKYARLFRVEKIISNYMEMLL